MVIEDVRLGRGAHNLLRNEETIAMIMVRGKDTNGVIVLIYVESP